MNNIEILKQNIKGAIKEIGISIDVLNDKGFGRMYAKAFKDILRFNVTNKLWYYYNGKVWEKDLENMNARRLAKLFSDELIAYSDELTLEKSVIDKILSLNGKGKRDTIIEDAKCEYTVKTEDFDTNIYLLNLQNGTLDLKTFELRPHNADDMLSKICNASYYENARSERWERCINEVTEGDTEKSMFLQRILGFCLTGDVKEEEFYILYGPTSRNGKSTVLETISHLLGGTDGYAVNVAKETFSGKTTRSGSGANGDIARLAGARMAVTSEFPPNMSVNTELIKTLTGRDKITARKIYEKEIEFYPQFKLFINTNYLPCINDDTLFESNRVNVIEFNKHFTEEEQDKELKTLLRKEDNLNGILNWLLEGLRLSREQGMIPPQSVIEATARFRKNCDKIGCFIDECLENTGKNMTMKDLYEVYRIWSVGNGYAYERKYRFKDILKNKHILQPTGTINGNTYSNVIIGYTLKPEYQSVISKTHTPQQASPQNISVQTEYTPRPPRVEADPTEIF